MKRQIILCLVLSFTLSALAQQGTVPKSGDLTKLSWLQGRWYLMKPKPGQTVDEYWKKNSGTEWEGKGITIRGKDTTVVEKLKIIDDGAALYYVADVAENKAPIKFKFTDIGDSHFVCENPGHDFPKKIEYRKNGDILTATISGNGKSIDYVFVRK